MVSRIVLKARVNRPDIPTTSGLRRTAASKLKLNPGVLNTRLRELRDVSLVEHDAGGYRLSDSGRTLLAAMQPLYEWAQRWKV